MSEKGYDGLPDLDRRTFLKGTVASTFVGTGLTAGTGLVAGAESGTLVVEQGGNSYEVEPLRTGETIEEFYGIGPRDRHGGDFEVDTSAGIERSDVSELFFFEGPDGLSLVVIHDTRDDSTGGAVTFSCSGLPDDGSWVVEDDLVGDDFAQAPDRLEWQWDGNWGDGGAFRGGLEDGFEITLDPDFISGIDSWQLLSPRSVQRRAFDLHNRYSSSTRTRGWEEVELDLSEFAGQEVTIRMQADGRWTYYRENTVSWIKADYVRIDGVLDEEFDGLDDWECTSEPRGGGSDDTPTKGFCRSEDGYAYVQEETNRTRYLSRTVQLPAEDDLVLRARVKGHINASWSHARLAVEGNAGASDPGRTELDTSEPATLRLEGVEDEPATVTEVTLPPTAVETGEEPTFALTVDPGSHSPDDVTVEAVAELSRRGDHVGSTAASTTTESDDGLVRIEGSVPSASFFSSKPEGVAFDTAIEVLADGEAVETLDARTFAFQEVDRVAAVVARASDTQPSLTDDDLFAYLREKAEFVNESYASGLGSMGAKGFDIEYVNRSHADPDVLDAGWVPLSGEFDDYHQPDTNGNGYYGDEDPGDNSVQFVTDALERAADDLGVDFSTYDTALVTNGPDQNRSVWELSKSFWAGEPLPTIELPIVNVEINLADYVGMSPFETPTGTIDALYGPIRVDTWRHELGHSLGQGLKVGFPDLYEPITFQNFGNVGNWGLMGGRDGKVITAFCRMLGSNFADLSNRWLDWDVRGHVVEDVDVSVSSLTDAEVGDDYPVVASAYAYVSVEWDGWTPSHEVDPQLGVFMLEGRPGGDSSIDDPGGNPIPLSPDPTDEDGVELYRYNGLEVHGDLADLRDILDDILNRRVPDLGIEDAELIDIEFLPSGHDDEVTLGTVGDTYVDDRAATEFELTEDLGGDGATVTLHRDVGALGNAYKIVVRLLGDLEDVVEENTSGTHEHPLPTLDVLAVTPDGRRVGTDPETGEVVNEIEGARVVTTPSEQRVIVPQGVETTATVSAERLKAALRERGLEPPAEFEYEREVLVDTDVTVEERDGVAFLDGRTAFRSTGTAGSDAPALLSAEPEVEPERVNAKSGGEFVTAHVGLPADVDPSAFVVESVALAGVPAVSDEQYGFVKNPPVEHRDGRVYVTVKFPRQAVVERLGTGTHEPAVFGVVGDAEFHGTAAVDVIDPGNGGGKSGNDKKGADGGTN
jgi:hypothetical protein